MKIYIVQLHNRKHADGVTLYFRNPPTKEQVLKVLGKEANDLTNDMDYNYLIGDCAQAVNDFGLPRLGSAMQVSNQWCRDDEPSSMSTGFTTVSCFSVVEN